MRWAGFKDRHVLERAVLEFDVLVTVDRSVRFQQVVPAPLSLITLHVPKNDIEAVSAMAPQILAVLEELAPGSEVSLIADVDRQRRAPR
jgi:hypothetical protein